MATTAYTLERDGCALHWWDGGPRDAPGVRHAPSPHALPGPPSVGRTR